MRARSRFFPVQDKSHGGVRLMFTDLPRHTPRSIGGERMPVRGLKIATALVVVLLIAAPAALVAQTDMASEPAGTWHTVKCPFPDKAKIDGHDVINQLTP